MMRFELSPEMYDQIIFAMEDQGSRSFVHRSTGQVVTEERLAPGEEYVPAPRWKPADGFHLMEGFVTTVPNRYYREQLRDALSAGRGVFRNFKNALKQSHDLECSWYRFKEREMRRMVAEWYNQEREAAGLERLGPEPEETEDLTISDFVVDTALPHQLAGASYVDHEALLELGQVPASELATCVKQRLCTLDGSHVVVARTPEDEVVGLAWARANCCSAPATPWTQFVSSCRCARKGLSGLLPSVVFRVMSGRYSPSVCGVGPRWNSGAKREHDRPPHRQVAGPWPAGVGNRHQSPGTGPRSQHGGCPLCPCVAPRGPAAGTCRAR